MLWPQVTWVYLNPGLLTKGAALTIPISYRSPFKLPRQVTVAGKIWLECVAPALSQHHLWAHLTDR